MKAGIEEIKQHHNHLKVWNLGSNIPHTALGETSICTPQVDAERASSVGICLTN